MRKVELILIIFLIIGFGMNLMMITGGSFFTVISLLGFAFFYFYFGFALFNNIRVRHIFKSASYSELSTPRILGAVAAGFALSSAIIGILFKIQYWYNGEFYLSAGIIGLLAITSVGVIKYIKTKDRFYTFIFKRMIIFGGLALCLYIAPNDSWAKIKYRNHPALRDAFINAVNHPEQSELWEIVDSEREKIYEKK